MAYKRKKATFGVLAPNIQRGGTAIPLGNNLYWMKGRKHKTGGIDIGKDLEVENNEVMQMLPNETRVFSSVKMLGGNSPAELVASGMNPDMVFNAQEQYKKINRIHDDGSRYKEGGKAKLGKRIKIKTNDGDRDIYYDDVKRRWVWGKNKVLLPYGHRIKFPDGYEYQLNSDGTRTRIGKKPNAAERAVTAPMKYTPNNDIPTAALDVMTAPLADDDKLYYNGILPLHNPSIYKDAPLYAYRTGDMSYLRNDDTSIYTPVRRARQDLPRKLYEFYNQDTIYMPSSLIENVDRLKQGITINQENVDPSYVYGPNNRIAIDARNHSMQIRNLGNNNYVADFSDIFDTNKEFFDSKANPMIFSQFGVPIVFTDDESKINQSFINEVNNALGKKYGGKQMNLQNIDNPLARNNKRMISPNKLGTIVRVDGNGRDRLAYIPSTGSSKQDMKCGGRVKAETGLSWGYYPPRDGLLFGEDIDYNIGRDNTSYRVPLFASNDNRITGLRLPTLGYLRPSDTFLANWMASANANNRDGVVNTQEPYGYVPRYSHLRLNTGSGDNNTTGSWSQFLTNLDTPTLIDKRTHKTDGANVYSTKKSDSVSPQSTNKKSISSYLDIVNDITKGESDWQGYAAAGVNALGSIVNSLIMNNALRKQRPPVRPVPKIAQKLKTKYNINPQLSENREATAQAVKDVLRNTASLQVGRNLVNNLGLQRAIADNKLFAEKENKETELINKDITNRESVDHENVDTYNKWLEARNDFYNNRSLLRAQNWASLVNGLGSAIGAGLGNIGASRRYRNNMLIAMLPYIKATGNG